MAGLVVLLIVPARAGSTAGKPWLWQCTQIHNVEAQYNCYVRLLRNDIEASGNPAREVPRIDRRVAAVGGPAEAGCHVLMHQVGREFARDHHVTLGNLQRYVPRSNNPNCSAGFGMGLVMYLGPQIIRSGGASAVRTCAELPTRYRQYTCVHGLGHALLRAYHGDLGQAVRACRALQRDYAPDCAQGVFHDYWISLRGADGTTAPKRMISPRKLCDGRLTYIRPCWYRYFLEQPLALPVRDAADLRRDCRGLHATRALRLHQRRGSDDLVESLRPDACLRATRRGGCVGVSSGRSRPGTGGSRAGAAAADPRVRTNNGRRAGGMLRVAWTDAGSRHERRVPRARVHEAEPGAGAAGVHDRRIADARGSSDLLLEGARATDRPRRRGHGLRSAGAARSRHPSRR